MTDSKAAPVPPIPSASSTELVANEERVHQAIERLTSGVEHELEAARARVTREVEGSLHSALEAAGVEHGRLVSALGGSQDPADWDACYRYVSAAAGGVLEALATYLEDSNPVQRLGELAGATTSALLTLVDSLPRDVTLALPLDLYASAGTDSAPVRVQKALTRGRISALGALIGFRNVVAGLVGRPPRTLPELTRIAPVRAHAAVAVQREVLPALHGETYEAASTMVEALSSLEKATSRWQNEVLDTLDALDAAANHAPEESLPESGKVQAAPSESNSVDGTSMISSAEALQVALEDARDACISASAAEPLAANLRSEMTRRMIGAGTFVTPEPRRARPPAAPLLPTEGAVLARDRLSLASRLASFRVSICDAERGLFDAYAQGILRPLNRADDVVDGQLSLMRQGALEQIRHLELGKTPEYVAHALERLHDELSASLEAAIRDIAQSEAAERAFSHPAFTATRQIRTRIADLPERLRVAIQEGGDRRTVTIPLRNLAEAAFERPLAPRLTPQTDQVRRALIQVWNESEQILHIVSTAFSAAVEELRPREETGSEVVAGPAQPEGSSIERGEAAIGLLDDGIQRAIDWLDTGYGSLRTSWDELLEASHGLIFDDWSHLHRAVRTEDFLAKQWHGLQTRITRGSEQAAARVGVQWERVSGAVRTVLRALRMRVSRLVRLGRSAVGVPDAGGARFQETLLALSSVSKRYSELPLIYRKVFSLEPLSDPGLAVNRQEDLAAFIAAYDRWRQGLGPGVFLVHGSAGAGRSSFLRLAARALDPQVRSAQCTLPRRLVRGQEFARVIHSTLDLEGNAPDDLQELSTQLHSADSPAVSVVFLDNLEHLMLQTSGGMQLLEDVLMFFARTDGPIFWCATLSDLAYRFLEKTRPSLVGLCVNRSLAPWTRQAVEHMITVRHRRTGMPVAFEPPDNPPPILKQRLKRARTPEAVQDLLRGEFFDSLFGACGQNPALGLFEWIRAGRFEERADVIGMPPSDPMSFAFVGRIDNDRGFALRAFLLHHTLSPAELSTLFRLTPDQALALTESLLTLGLVESAEAGDSPSSVDPSHAFRLRKLVVEPVRGALRERRFLY